MQNLQVLLHFTRVEHIVDLGDIEGRLSDIRVAIRVNVDVVVDHMRVCGYEAKVDEERLVADNQSEVAIARWNREVNRSALN